MCLSQLSQIVSHIFTFKHRVFWETFSLEWSGSLWESREVSPRFVRPYPILVSVGPVAYRIGCTFCFGQSIYCVPCVHACEHIWDPSRNLFLRNLSPWGVFSYVRRIQFRFFWTNVNNLLRSKVSSLVTVLWEKNPLAEVSYLGARALGDATWYPHLFTWQVRKFRGRNFFLRRGELLRPENSRS